MGQRLDSAGSDRGCELLEHLPLAIMCLADNMDWNHIFISYYQNMGSNLSHPSFPYPNLYFPFPNHHVI
jgi:hypothetical protein